MTKLIQKVLLNMCPPESMQDPQHDRNTVYYFICSHQSGGGQPCVLHITHNDLRGSSSVAQPSASPRQLLIHPSLCLTVSESQCSHHPTLCGETRASDVWECYKAWESKPHCSEISVCARPCSCLYVDPKAYRLALPGRLWIYFTYCSLPYGF